MSGLFFRLLLTTIIIGAAYSVYRHFAGMADNEFQSILWVFGPIAGIFFVLMAISIVWEMKI